MGDIKTPHISIAKQETAREKKPKIRVAPKRNGAKLLKKGKEMKETELQVAIQAAREELSHGCDGPITPFVLISRATELVGKKKATAEAAANALYEELQSFGLIKDPNAILSMNGS